MDFSDRRASMTMPGSFPQIPDRGHGPSFEADARRATGMSDGQHEGHARQQHNHTVNHTALPPHVAEAAPSPGLVQRFYRVPRRNPVHLFSAQSDSAQQARQDRSHASSMDTDTESFSSVLSVNLSELSVKTEATSVLSDNSDTNRTTASKVPSPHLRRVQQVPPSSKDRPSATRRANPPPAACESIRDSAAHKKSVQFGLPPASTRERSSKTGHSSPGRPEEHHLLVKIEQLEADSKRLHTSNDRLSRELAVASERVSSMTVDHRALDKAVKQERAAKEAFVRDIEAHRQMLDETRSNLELQKGLLHETETERDCLRQAKCKLEKELAQLRDDLAGGASASLSREKLLVGHVAKLEAETDSRERQMAARDRELSRLRLEGDGLRRQLSAQEPGLQALQAAQREKIRLTADCASLQAEIKRSQTRVTQLEDELAVSSRKLRDMQAAKTDVETRLGQASSDREKGESKMREQVEEIEALKASIQQLDSVQQALQESHGQESAEYQGRIARLTIDLEGSRDANISLAADKLSAETKLSGTQDALAAAMGEIDRLSDRQAVLIRDINRRTSELEQLRKRHAKLEDRLQTSVADLKSQITEAVDRLATSQKELSSVRQVKDKLQADHLKAVKELQSLASKHDVQECPSEEEHTSNEPGAQSAPPEGRTKEVAEINSRLTETITDLESQNQALQAEASKVGPLTTQCTHLTSQVGTVTARAEQLTGQVATLTGKLEQACAGRESAEARVRQLEALVAQLNKPASGTSSHARPNHHKRSASSGGGIIFVRQPGDRWGAVQITTRKALSRASSHASRAGREKGAGDCVKQTASGPSRDA